MEDNILLKELFISWMAKDNGIYKNNDILNWVKNKNTEIYVNIKKIQLEDSKFWFYDNQKGVIRNKNNSFFYIIGLKEKIKYEKYNNFIEQPVIIQNEIGYLGFICKKINGILHFLVQAKIEPGNINKIQLSPTIQATKSNFMQTHGGKRPAYLEYFLNSEKYTILVDQIQSEQSSRFYKKRNRNVIIYLEDKEQIDVLPSHKWMTLGQIKEMMKIDNIVNMDTRTVLSCIPFYRYIDEYNIKDRFIDKALYNSLFLNNENYISCIYRKINNYKMFLQKEISFIDLFKLKHWSMNGDEFSYKYNYPFKIIFCDITIEGREITNWTQPLFEAEGIAVFGLLTKVLNNKRLFLVRLCPECGCFDDIELGPSIQKEANDLKENNIVEKKFFENLHKGKNIIFDTLLSEEGGRFFHEQNRNVIMEIDDGEIVDLPEEYIWVDLKTLNELVQMNNVLNIQLRNLISILEA